MRDTIIMDRLALDYQAQARIDPLPANFAHRAMTDNLLGHPLHRQPLEALRTAAARGVRVT